MILSSGLLDFWVQLHYRYKNVPYKFNLPLPQGDKVLDGLKLSFRIHTVSGGLRLTAAIESMEPVEIESFVLTGGFPYGDNLLSVFANGYQSWTDSRERSPGNRISALQWPGRLFALQRLGDASFYPYSERRGRFHGYGYAYLRYPERIILFGSLDDRHGYSIIGTDIRQNILTLTKDLQGLKLDGREEILDMILLEGAEDEVFNLYSSMRVESFHKAPRVFGCFSKSRKNRRLDELTIRRNLGSLRDKAVPLDYFIIGEGWQSTLGEWKLLAPGFPSGMASLGAEIRGSGYAPGLWFAPFVVGINSTIFRTRKDWLAREEGKSPKPVGRMSRHGGVFFALDITRTDVRQYISENYQRIRDEWRFDLIYMDLLYAVGIYGKDGISRGAMMKQAMEFLFSLKKDEVWVVSGIPLETAFGLVEYARIAADTTRYWENLSQKKLHSRERSSTINALKTTIGRRHLDGRFFGNALDSFHLSPQKGAMEAHRRYTQLLLHLLFGHFITTSDDISEYGREETALFSSLFPFIKPEIQSCSDSRGTLKVRYSAAGRHYMCVSNLNDRNRSFQLPEGPWFGMPALGIRAHHIAGGLPQHLKAGESRNYLQLQNGDAFAGSSGHIFSGAEIAQIRSDDENWVINTIKPNHHPFRIWLRVDSKVSKPTINGEASEIRHVTPIGDALISGVVVSLPDKSC